MAFPGIKLEPPSSPLLSAQETYTQLKRKAHSEVGTLYNLPLDSSSDSDVPLAKKHLRERSTAKRSLSSSDKIATTKEVKDSSPTSRGRGTLARRQRKESPSSEAGDVPRTWPVMVQGRFDMKLQKYVVFWNTNMPATAGSYPLSQPRKTAARSPGAKEYSTPVSSTSSNGIGEGLSDRKLRPRTKSVEYRFVYPGDQPPRSRSSPIAAGIARHHTTDGEAQTPNRGPTGPTSTIIAGRHIARAVTGTSPPPPPEPAATTTTAHCGTNTAPPLPLEPATTSNTADSETNTSPAPLPEAAARTMVDTATNTRSYTVIYVDSYPFIIPADPVESFRKIQSQVLAAYNAVIGGEGTAWERAVASTGCTVSEFGSGGGGGFVSEDEAGGGEDGSSDGGGGRGTEEEEEEEGTEEEDYGAPKD